MSFQDLEAGRSVGLRRGFVNGKQDPTQAVASGIFQINTAVSTFQRLVNTLGTPKDTPELREKLWVLFSFSLSLILWSLCTICELHIVNTQWIVLDLLDLNINFEIFFFRYALTSIDLIIKFNSTIVQLWQLWHIRRLYLILVIFVIWSVVIYGCFSSIWCNNYLILLQLKFFFFFFWL